MNTKHYLIGAFNNGKEAQVYFDSLEVLGDTVEPIIVQYQKRGEFQKVRVPSNVKLIKYQKEYPGNTGKNKDFREIVAPLLERDAWCIFTDMHDVIFQAPLPQFPEGEILVASEGNTFGEINYWKNIFPPDIWSENIYNVGCFAMKKDLILKFWNELYEGWMDFHQWYKQGTIMRIGNGETFPFNIPFHEKVRIDMAVMFNGHYDTLSFNRFIRKHRITELPGLFGCYAYQVNHGVIEDKKGKLYQKGKLVSIAHFNGDSKVYMKGGKHEL